MGTRSNSKSTTDDSISLDIRLLRKKWLLGSMATGTLSWLDTGQVIASIDYKINDCKITLYHDLGEIFQTIYFEKTPCNYGGERFWFLCPECGSRREVLYLMGKSFVCRSCADLNYKCQHEQPLARLQRKSRKIRHKLKTNWLEPDNLSIPVVFKPKGMHQTTFDRLQRKQRGFINHSGQILLDRFEQHF